METLLLLTATSLPAERLAAINASNCIDAMFVWLISHQPALLFSQNKPAITNQPTVLFSQNKSVPTISHQPNEQAASRGFKLR
jgi:hypothetical protein